MIERSRNECVTGPVVTPIITPVQRSIWYCARTPDDWADLFHTTHIHTHAGGPLIVPAFVCIKVAVLCQESASVFERGRNPPSPIIADFPSPLEAWQCS